MTAGLSKVKSPFLSLPLLRALTSFQPHPFLPNPVLILRASVCEFIFGLPAPLSCHIVSHTHRQSTREAQTPFISHPKDQPANHLQSWMTTVNIPLLYSLSSFLFHPYILFICPAQSVCLLYSDLMDVWSGCPPRNLCNSSLLRVHRFQLSKYRFHLRDLVAIHFSWFKVGVNWSL